MPHTRSGTVVQNTQLGSKTVMSHSEMKPNEPAGVQDERAGRRRRVLLPRLRVVVVALSFMLLTVCGVWLYFRFFVEPLPVRHAGPEGGHVIFLPTPQDVVERMLTVADVKRNDLVYDLGCGDGRVLVTASKTYGCQSRGYDIDPIRVRESRENARKHDVEELVEVYQEDIFTLDLREADVIFLYLLPKLNVRLIPQLQQLRTGSRIVSHNFEMPGVQPDKVWTMVSTEGGGEHVLYLWTTPLTFTEAAETGSKR